MARTGRPNKQTSETDVKKLIIKLVEKGLYIEEIADVLSINKTTIYEWQKTDADFSNAVSVKKQNSASDEVRKNIKGIIKALIKRAKGFHYLEVKQQYDGDDVLVSTVKTKKYAVPDTQAIQYILDKFDSDGAEELGLTINVRYNDAQQ